MGLFGLKKERSSCKEKMAPDRYSARQTQVYLQTHCKRADKARRAYIFVPYSKRASWPGYKWRGRACYVRNVRNVQIWQQTRARWGGSIRTQSKIFWRTEIKTETFEKEARCNILKAFSWQANQMKPVLCFHAAAPGDLIWLAILKTTPTLFIYFRKNLLKELILSQ